MLHTQDNTGMQLTNATTMPLTGAISNLHEYKKMSINGLYLKDISCLYHSVILLTYAP